VKNFRGRSGYCGSQEGRSGPGVTRSRASAVVVCRIMGSMQDAEPARLLTLTAVAKATRLSRSTVHKLVDRGALPHVRIGVRRRVTARELDKWIERSLVHGEGPSKPNAMTVQERGQFAKPLGKAVARPAEADE
jgi:excisionase family DNA binding protein